MEDVFKITKLIDKEKVFNKFLALGNLYNSILEKNVEEEGEAYAAEYKTQLLIGIADLYAENLFELELCLFGERYLKDYQSHYFRKVEKT